MTVTTEAAHGLERSRGGGVLRLVLARPETLNAVTTELLQELAATLAAAGEDPEVRAITLSGAQGAFCAGADVGPSSGGATVESANEAIRALQSVPVPVIALVHGPAAGVGCSLALACDLVLMGRSAYLMLAFTRIGLMPAAVANQGK